MEVVGTGKYLVKKVLENARGYIKGRKCRKQADKIVHESKSWDVKDF